MENKAIPRGWSLGKQTRGPCDLQNWGPALGILPWGALMGSPTASSEKSIRSPHPHAHMHPSHHAVGVDHVPLEDSTHPEAWWGEPSSRNEEHDLTDQIFHRLHKSPSSKKPVLILNQHLIISGLDTFEEKRMLLRSLGT